MPAIERRCGELRAHGRRLTGTVMAYGDVAEIPGIGRERFAAFAFAGYLRSGATALNVMHDEALTIASTGDVLTFTDSPADLRMVATLPQGDAFDQVLGLVGDGSTTGLSVEFHALDERRTADTRTILRATLPGLGIVDTPAYAASGVEVRRDGRGVFGRFDYNTPRVIADRGRRRKETVRPDAFADTLEDETREIVIQIGDDAGQVLGAKRAGSVTFGGHPGGSGVRYTGASGYDLRAGFHGAADGGDDRAGGGSVLPHTAG